MKKIDKPFPDTTRQERKQMMLDIFDARFSFDTAGRVMEFARTNTPPGGKLSDTVKEFLEVSAYSGNANYQAKDIQDLFLQLRELNQTDPSKAKAFTGILKANTDVNESSLLFETAEKIPGNYSIIDKSKAVIELNGYNMRYKMDENFDCIIKSRYPGESLETATRQFVRLQKAVIEQGSIEDIDRRLFADLKQSSRDNPSLFLSLMEFAHPGTGYDILMKTADYLEIPIRNESINERSQALSKMAALMRGQRDEGIGTFALENMEVIASNIDKDESLGQAADRFSNLLTALGGREQYLPARDAFKFVKEKTKDGAFHGKTAAQITNKLIETLMLTGDLEKAKESLFFAMTTELQKDRSINKGDDFIEIGGVRLKIGKS